MRGFWWKLLLAAGCALQANGASAQGVCNYNNPASPNYCTNVDVSEQKARFRSLNDDFTTNATSEADRSWRDTEFDQMRSNLSGCVSQPENVVGCQFQVYRKFADALQGRLEQRDQTPAEPQAPPPSEVDLGAESEVVAPMNDVLEKADPSKASKTADLDVSNGSQSKIDTSSTGSQPINGERLNSVAIVAGLVALLIIALMTLRTYRGNSGVRERKFLLFSIYCVVGLVAGSLWEIVWWLKLVYFVGIPIVIWGPSITSYPIRRLLLRYYGFQGADLDEEFNEWAAEHSATWARAAQGAMESLQSNNKAGGTPPSGSTSTKPDERHKKVGNCNGRSSMGGSNQRCGNILYKCGKCGHAGCQNSICSQRSFQGSQCSVCEHFGG